MTYGSSSANVETQGSNRLIAGRYLVETGYDCGAIAQLVDSLNLPTQHPLSVRLDVAKRSKNNIIGRDSIAQEIITLLENQRIIEICGEYGVGKTTLVQHLASYPRLKTLFADGIIYLYPSHPYIGDILQQIWQCFYENPEAYLPNYQNISHGLRDKQALIILDEDHLTTDELKLLFNTLSECSFVCTSSGSRIAQEGYSIRLNGLEVDDAISLLQDVLKRKLEPEEIPGAKSLCNLLKGYPTYLKQAAAITYQSKRTLEEIASCLSTSDPGKDLSNQILSCSTPLQLKILELLSIMGTIGLKDKQVMAILQVPECLSALENLCQRHVVKFDGIRYTLSHNVQEVLPPEYKLEESFTKILNYFEKSIEETHQHQAKKIRSEIDAIAQIIEVAVRNSCWQDVIYLVRMVDDIIAVSKKWSLWENVLQRGMQAAQALQRPLEEAWAHHQLGIISLVFGFVENARKEFNYALEIRELLNDQTGVSAVRHNLRLTNAYSKEESVESLNNQLNNQFHTHLPKFDSSNASVFKKSEQKLRGDILGKQATSKPQATHQETYSSFTDIPLPISQEGLIEKDRETTNGAKKSIFKSAKSSVNGYKSDPAVNQPNAELDKDKYLSLNPTYSRSKTLFSPVGIMGISAGVLLSSSLLAWATWNQIAEQPIAGLDNSTKTKTKPKLSEKDLLNKEATVTKPSLDTQTSDTRIPSLTPSSDKESNIPSYIPPNVEPPSAMAPVLRSGIKFESSQTNFKNYKDYPSLQVPIKKIPSNENLFHPRVENRQENQSGLEPDIKSDVKPKIQPETSEKTDDKAQSTPKQESTPPTTNTPFPESTSESTLEQLSESKSVTTSSQATPNPNQPNGWNIFTESTPTPETENNPSFTPVD